MTTQETVFCDLISGEEGVLFSPNTWTARMSLLHKGVPFRAEFIDGKALLDRGPGSIWKLNGEKKPILPFILHEGRLINDSWRIAEYLETAIPGERSLFVPAAEPGTPEAKTEGPAYQTARALALVLKQGMGASDSRWSYIFELAAPGIARNMKEPFATYFMSDEKQGMPNAWQKLTRKAADARRYLTEEKALEVPVEGDWDGDVEIPHMAQWIERMLDLYDGHARRELSRPCIPAPHGQKY